MFNTLNYTNAMIKLASRFLLFRLGVASSFRSAYLDTISYTQGYFTWDYATWTLSQSIFEKSFFTTFLLTPVISHFFFWGGGDSPFSKYQLTTSHCGFDLHFHND